MSQVCVFATGCMQVFDHVTLLFCIVLENQYFYGNVCVYLAFLGTWWNNKCTFVSTTNLWNFQRF